MMFRADFVSQLDLLKRRGRLVVYGGIGVALPFNAFVVFETFRRFPPREHNPEAVPWYLAALVITSIPVLALWIVFRYVVARYAPACPSCHARATWIERDEILSSGRCPKCGAELPWTLAAPVD